jgi:uncharacterized membrane protein YesL
MPFLDDVGVRDDDDRGPVWEAFAALADQVERLVAVNVAWASQLLPGVLALGFPEWPTWLRLGLGLYSATVLVPATGALFGLAEYARRRDHLSIELAGQLFRQLAVPSFRVLAPLYGTLGVLLWATLLASWGGGPAILGALLVFALLLALLCATYWGPLLAARPDAPVTALARRSVELAWREPGATLVTGGVAALALVIGVISVGGLFLIVPVVIALLQTCRYADVAGKQLVGGS